MKLIEKLVMKTTTVTSMNFHRGYYREGVISLTWLKSSINPNDIIMFLSL